MTSKNKKTIDRKPIEDLSSLLDELNLTEISYQEGDFAISVSRAAKGDVSNSLSTSTADSQNQKNKEGDYSSDPRAIKSTMFCSVYLHPDPGSKTFFKEGDQVKNGQTLLIIEAMKTMNPIESTLQGKVSKILVENEQAVEFGQPLMLID